jgi:alkylation response protein AidB-like acyl-CoA dehydrogenase
MSSPLLEAARKLAPTIRTYAGDTEAIRALPAPVFEALFDAGIFLMAFPRSIGGGELDLPTYIQVIEELAKADASTGWVVNQCAIFATYAARMPRALARKLWIDTPRSVVANTPQANAQAVVVEGGYRVTGRWGFATGSRHAKWLGCHTPLFDPDGSPRKLPNGRQQVRTMVFRKSEAQIIDNWQVLGLRGTGSDSYALKDHFVPQNFTAGRDNFDELREKGPLYQFTSGMIYAMSFAHVSMGIAKGAFDAFIEIARDKVPRGAKGTLRENNVIQSQVSQCEAKLKSSRAYLRGVIAEMWDEARNTGQISADYHPQLRLAATWAINQSRDIVATIYQAAGSTAIFENNPLERRMRDIHAGTQQGQGRQVHFETVGQIMMGLPPEGRMFR